MARPGGSPALFWSIFLIGGATLAACLILPALLEYRKARQQYALALERDAALQQRIQALENQIEHLARDETYLSRIARKEFGLEPSDVEVLMIDNPDRKPDPNDAPPAVVLSTTRLDVIAERVERAARRNPLVSVLLLDTTRPIVMALAGLAVICALFLLSPSRAAAKAVPPA